LQLKSIHLNQFKIYKQADFQFDNKVICIVGPNGSGKTNLLDAIYFLCIGKSYFNPVDQQNIQHDCDFFRIKGNFVDDVNEQYEIICTCETGKRKRLFFNDAQYAKIAEHIGKMPVVVIAPDDIEMINGSSSERRKFIDFNLSFADHQYLIELQAYVKVLQQRNAYLKQTRDAKPDEALLSSFDKQMIGPAHYIFEKRKSFIETFKPIFNHFYDEISGQNEKPGISLKSHLFENRLKDLLKQNRQRDLASQRTTEGVHRDDLAFAIDGHELKKYGSQGQKKTFLTALKLAQFQFLKQNTLKNPILLLDDIFDKLDQKRAMSLLSLTIEKDFGQIFITDTNNQRLEDIFNGLKIKIDKIEIQND
jgi:DNA replication and repair protein RecF